MRTKKTTVILISGNAGSGKTTLAGILYDKLLEFPAITVEKYSFAGPLKYIAAKFFGWDGEKDDKGRRLLQRLGGTGREYNVDLWVEYMLKVLDGKSMFPCNFVLVDDWRFPNERAFLEKNPLMEVFPVRVIGRKTVIINPELQNDRSEVSLLDDGDYYFVDNSGTLDELTSKADALVDRLEKLYIVE